MGISATTAGHDSSDLTNSHSTDAGLCTKKKNYGNVTMAVRIEPIISWVEVGCRPTMEVPLKEATNHSQPGGRCPAVGVDPFIAVVKRSIICRGVALVLRLLVRRDFQDVSKERQTEKFSK